jgi:hypothetical protein
LFTLVNTRSKTHWVAVEVDFDKQKVTVMDSMCPETHSTERTEIRKISTNIKKWAEKQADARNDATGTDTTTLYDPVESWQAKLCITCPQQTMTFDGKSYENVWDCGLFALAVVACIQVPEVRIPQHYRHFKTAHVSCSMDCI